jgi:ubiquinone/menaquinone biosynthesis C-methylase UbiE
LADACFDVVVSNCVVNLSPDKDAVLRQVHRLLKPGGEFYWNDFQHLTRHHGFGDPRLVEDRSIAITDPALAARTEGNRFHSATYRLWRRLAVRRQRF